jgi:hypothetical protein
LINTNFHSPKTVQLGIQYPQMVITFVWVNFSNTKLNFSHQKALSGKFCKLCISVCAYCLTVQHTHTHTQTNCKLHSWMYTLFLETLTCTHSYTSSVGYSISTFSSQMLASPTSKMTNFVFFCSIKKFEVFCFLISQFFVPTYFEVISSNLLNVKNSGWDSTKYLDLLFQNTFFAF